MIDPENDKPIVPTEYDKLLFKSMMNDIYQKASEQMEKDGVEPTFKKLGELEMATDNLLDHLEETFKINQLLNWITKTLKRYGVIK